jgi:CRISPR-associated protein Cmr4
VASPYTLSLLKTELLRCGLPCDIAVPQFAANAEHYKGTATADTVLKVAGDAQQQQRILLEEIDLLTDAGNAASVDAWASRIAELLYGNGDDKRENRELFCQRFLVVDDNVLNFFCETALPVSARIRIDNETGTVQDGALWYEEFVPAETVFLGLLSATDGFGKYREFKAKDLLVFIAHEEVTCQLGGKASTGRGMVSFHFAAC